MIHLWIESDPSFLIVGVFFSLLYFKICSKILIFDYSVSYCLFCTGYLQISLRIIDKNVCNVANKCLNIGKCISANGK